MPSQTDGRRNSPTLLPFLKINPHHPRNIFLQLSLIDLNQLIIGLPNPGLLRILHHNLISKLLPIRRTVRFKSQQVSPKTTIARLHNYQHNLQIGESLEHREPGAALIPWCIEDDELDLIEDIGLAQHFVNQSFGEEVGAQSGVVEEEDVGAGVVEAVEGPEGVFKEVVVVKGVGFFAGLLVDVQQREEFVLSRAGPTMRG